MWVNIGSGNVLLTDGTKPLPEPLCLYMWKAQEEFIHSWLPDVPCINHEKLSCSSRFHNVYMHVKSFISPVASGDSYQAKINNWFKCYFCCDIYHKADSRFAPSQWETALQSNTVSHWLGASLESALYHEVQSLLVIFTTQYYTM